MATTKVEDEHVETSSAIDTIQPKGRVGEEVLDSHIHDDHGDPHRAALENANAAVKVTPDTWAAVFFLGFLFHASLSCTLFSAIPVSVSIAVELQGSVANVNWMSAGWSLAGSISFAVAGQLSDFFGRNDIIRAAQALLILGHLIGASAQGINQMFAAMAILGAGTGTAFVGFASISELLPNKYRPYGLASCELQLLLTSTFGPLCARALVQNTALGWRWIFIIGEICAIIATTGCAIFYKPPHRVFADRSKTQLFKELDYLGIFLYTAGVTLILLAFGWAGTRYTWSSAAVITPLVIGVVLFSCSFIWGLSGRPARPLFPSRLFKMYREFLLLLMVIFTTGLAHITLGVYVPQEISYTFTTDPIKAGLYNIPNGFAGVVGGVILGAYVHKMKRIPLQLFVGNAVQTIFCGLLALITPDRIPMALVFQLIAGTPFGWLTLICYLTAGLHVAQRDLGLAYGLVGSFRFLGGAVGSTIFNTILRNRVAVDVPNRVTDAISSLDFDTTQVPALIQALGSKNPAQLAEFPADVVQLGAEGLRWGYSDAFSYVWLASIPFGVIACVISFFVVDPSPYFTNHTAVHSRKEAIGKHTEEDVTYAEKRPENK